MADPKCPNLDNPWRKGVADNWDEKEVADKMREVLATHETIGKLLTNEERERGLTVFLVGPSGHGKSSTINGIFAALETKYKELAIVKNQEKHSTLEFRRHRPRLPIVGEKDDKITVEEDELDTDYFNVAFADFVGVDKGQTDESADYKTQMRAAVYGLLKQGHKAEREDTDATGKVEKEEEQPQVHETTLEASSMLWVVDIQSEKDDLGYMSDIVALATRQGIPQSLVLTKCDKADESVSRNPRNMYFSEEIRKKVDETAAYVGVPMYRTFPVKNYIDEMEVEPQLAYQYLYMLGFVLYDIEARLRALLRNDPERKKKLREERDLRNNAKQQT